MTRIISRITPSFLKNIDRHLLLNHPHIWATRIHYLVFVVAIAGILMLLQGSLSVVQAADAMPPESIFMISLIPMALIGLIWVWQAKQFLTERNHGRTNRQIAWRDQLIFLFGLGLLLSVPLLYSIQYHIKVHGTVSEAELKSDLIALNDGWPYFTRHSGMWDEKDKFDEHNPFIQAHIYHPHILESLYADDLPSKADVFNQMDVDNTTEKLERIEAFKHAYERYTGKSIPGSSKAFLSEYERGTLLFKLSYEDKYQLESQIELLSEVKFGIPFWSGNDHGFIYFSMLILTGILVLFSVFRQVSWKSFALASGLVTAIIFGLVFMSELLRSYNEDLIILLTIPALFGISAAIGFSKDSPRSWARVNLILTSGTLISMPIILCILMTDELNLLPRYINEVRIEKFAIILAVILAPVLWQMVFRPRLVKLESAPAKK